MNTRNNKRLCFTFIFVSLSSEALAGGCYFYDSLGRLKTVVHDITDHTDPNKIRAETSYVLDEHGNRVTVNVVNTATSACGFPSGSVTTGSNGPLTSDGFGGGDPLSSGNQDPLTGGTHSVSMLINSTQQASPLAGASDPNGDPLSITSIGTPPSLFSASLSNNIVTIGSFQQVGSGTVSYIISDGQGGTAQGTISVSVSSEPSPPPPTPPPPPPPGTCGNTPSNPDPAAGPQCQ